jgi:hypothetical protein
MFKLTLSIIPLLLFFSSSYAQESDTPQDSIEVYLLDSYIPPEMPNIFRLSFLTSAPSKSKVIIENKYEYPVSDTLVENHDLVIDLTDLRFESETTPFVIFVEDSLGHTYNSERFEFEIPEELKREEESNFYLFCLFGGIVFLVPSPAYIIQKEDSYFSLTKEIPLVMIRSGSYNYPLGYFSIEYSHIFDAPINNLLRLGYKHIFETSGIKYISPGINGFTNFNGFNGISPEFSVGLFEIANTFTFYVRYRFNFKPGEPGSESNEISIGLYSGAFTLYF